MPRQGRSGAGRAPSRPSVSKSNPAPQYQQQSRPATSLAQQPVSNAPAAPQASVGSGLFGQMASTAAGVAVGSSIGHAIGGLFSGGSSQPVAEPQNNNVASQNSQDQQSNWGPKSCDIDAKQFTKCLDDNQGNMQICNWYLEQLKACQQAASPY